MDLLAIKNPCSHFKFDTPQHQILNNPNDKFISRQCLGLNLLAKENQMDFLAFQREIAMHYLRCFRKSTLLKT